MSMYLWFGLMIATSVLWTLWFFYRPLKDNRTDLESSNIELGKQKQLELEQDLEQGLINDGEFNKAVEEITQTLAIELNQTSVNLNKKQGTLWWAIILVLIALPATSLLTYNYLAPKHDVEKVASIAQVQNAPLSLEQSVVKIKQGLVGDPNNADSWKILGLTYFELGQLEESLGAYERAYQLAPKDIGLLVEYASVIATSQNDQFVGRASTLVREALEINPNAPDALYLAGLVSVNAGQFDLAKKVWQRALSLLPQDHPDRTILENILVELAEIQGEGIPQHQVTVNVDLSERLRQAEFSEYYLMVYIKAAQGRPMPIAIQKIKLKDFSGKVVLTDGNSVMPSSKLSQSSEVVAVVRLSQSGSAMKQANDVQVLSPVINVRDNPTVNLQVE